MKKIDFIYLLVSIITLSCNSIKKNIIETHNENDPIQISIIDFSKSTRLYKINNVFSVSKFVSIINNDLIVVAIGANPTKLLMTKDVIIGSKGRLPSRFFEKNGKLFFWWDNEFPLSENALAVYKKYNLLQDDENGRIKVPDIVKTASEKGAHYYFCNDDLLNYKKVISNIGLGYYEPPSLHCK